MTLYKAKKGQTVRIQFHDEHDELKKLLMGMGLLPGDEVQIIGESFLGSPVAFRYNGNDFMAMRAGQAKRIKVENVN